MATIIGNRILSDTSPSLIDLNLASFTGYVWENTGSAAGAGNISEWAFYANPGAGSWEVMYNIKSSNGGLALLSGANFTGPVIAPGVAKTNNQQFTGTLTIQGKGNVATENYVIQQVDALSATISQLVNQAVASAGSTSGTSTNVAKKSGYYEPISNTSSTVPTHKEIPLPAYNASSSNITAKASECIWIASMGNSSGVISPSVLTTTQTLVCAQVQPRIYRSYIDLYSAAGTHTYISCGLNWLIIGIRYSAST